MSGSVAIGIDELPATLPIFPLSGVLLLPRGRLPLNIFEPRYLSMMRDALGGDRLIGMVQPCAATPVAGTSPDNAAAVYPTGCAGRITAFSETEDGRMLITLTGISRFQIREEVATVRGYRRIVPDWLCYRGDLAEPGPASIGQAGLDRPRLIAGLKAFFRLHAITADWDAIAMTPDERLVNSLAMICPFAPNEKQALLEAPGLAERADLMTALIEMAVLDRAPDGAAAAPN